MPVLTTTATIDPPDEWLTGAAARRRLKMSYCGLQRLAILRRVATLIEPGIPPRYSRTDVDRIARTRSAIAS